jgi:hypothetical protein
MFSKYRFVNELRPVALHRCHTKKIWCCGNTLGLYSSSTCFESIAEFADSLPDFPCSLIRCLTNNSTTRACVEVLCTESTVH